jgi:hypothetical protein
MYMQLCILYCYYAGMVTGATIHTENGLSMTARRRQPGPASTSSSTNRSSSSNSSDATVNGVNGHHHTNGQANGHVNGHVNGHHVSSEGKCPF